MAKVENWHYDFSIGAQTAKNRNDTLRFFAILRFSGEGSSNPAIPINPVAVESCRRRVRIPTSSSTPGVPHGHCVLSTVVILKWLCWYIPHVGSGRKHAWSPGMTRLDTKISWKFALGQNHFFSGMAHNFLIGEKLCHFAHSKLQSSVSIFQLQKLSTMAGPPLILTQSSAEDDNDGEVPQDLQLWVTITPLV